MASLAAPNATQPPYGAPLIGAQAWPHSFVHEGMEAALDVLQETAHVNAVMVVAANRGSPTYRATRWKAGHRERAGNDVRLGGFYTTPHPEHYRAGALQPVKSPDSQLAGVDVLARLVEVARPRGVTVYAYLFDGLYANPPEALAPGLAGALAVDALGRPVRRPCFNNPRYRGFILGMVEDHARSYDVDGIYFQFEGFGEWSPFHLLFHSDAVPVCFCEHCGVRAAARGWSAERAREGYLEALKLVRESGTERPRDGYLATLVRLLIKFPEILAWQTLWKETRDQMLREIYGVVKALAPGKQMAWNILHAIQIELFHRASFDYAEVGEFADWIKPNLYHRVAGPRFARNARAVQRGIFRDWGAEDVGRLLFEAFGYGGPASLDDVAAKGLAPEEFVYKEARRVIDAAGPDVPVCPGIDLEAPGSPPTEAENVRASIEQAFRAGARGVVLSRFYDEWSLESLRAAGEAIGPHANG